MAHAVTKDTFEAEVLKVDEVVLVDFWAPWCGPCQMLLPVMEELGKNPPAGTKVCKVNVDEEAELASTYGVMSIPTIKVFKGGKIVDETVGVQSKEQLEELLAKHTA